MSSAAPSPTDCGRAHCPSTMSDGATKPPVVHEAHEVDTFHVPKAFFE